MSSGLTGSCFGSPAKYTTRARRAAISRAACWACFEGAATLTRSAPAPSVRAITAATPLSLPAPDRPTADDDDGVPDPDVEHLHPVQRACERVRHRGQVREEVRRQEDQVLHGDRRHRGDLRVRAGE